MSWTYNPFTGTFDAKTSLAAGSVTEYRTITAAEETAKQLTLANTPADPAKVLLDIISGSPQVFGADYSVSSNILTWNGLALETILAEGDKLRIIYQLS